MRSGEPQSHTILGLNAYHGDASACLVIDGTIVAAAEEERFRRVKHWAGFPSESIRYCLSEGKISFDDVDHIAINSNPKANIFRRLRYALVSRPSVTLLLDRLRNQGRRFSIDTDLRGLNSVSHGHARLHRVEHHLAHLSSCFLVSPFYEAVALSVDGFGDFASAAWGLGRGHSLSVDGRVLFPHSLGIFYQALTQYLGFYHYGDEYKVMGLAPYGRPTYLSQMRHLVQCNANGSFALNLDFFRHHKEIVSFQWQAGAPEIGHLYSDKLCQLLGPPRGPTDTLDQRHRDIAHSAQGMYEEAFFGLLNALHARYQVNDLTLAGGCAMNSVANGKVRRMTPFKRLYVQAAAGDAGGALGAAIHVWQRVREDCSIHKARQGSVLEGDTVQDRIVMDQAYWGPHYNNEMIGELLDDLGHNLRKELCHVQKIEDVTELCERTAKAVSEGLVIGWFQGRMEWGPRALGNRSIICDPRRRDMKEILNRKIKRRESFRPFAPSVLREHVADWFEEEADVPFMMQVFQVREDKRVLIPAVTHVDGSGRLQTVHRETNPRYYRLIECFHQRTGVPMVLNTSFNENEPVVCRPQEALDCFLRTKMDWVVLQDWIVQRR
jgi:carbamoyltransferase